MQVFLRQDPTMTIVRSRLNFITVATVCITVLLLTVHHMIKQNNLTVATVLNMPLPSSKINEETANQSLSVPKVILPASYDSPNEAVYCMKADLMNMAFPICLYDAKTDDTVSGLLLRGTYFEASEISRFIRLLQLDRRLQLVDIGANVGLWSLPAARVTHVLAVEPNWRSMSRLAKAVDLGAASSNITLIHNAISDVRTTLYMGVYPTNQGNAFLINSDKCTKTPIGLRCNTLPPTKTILLNDLLPLMRSRAALLKVDVEGHEINVFTDSSAGQFFDHVDVPVVIMEWKLCTRHSSDVLHRLLNFFYSRNYTAYNLNNSKLEEEYLNWPKDVLFKKPPYVRL